MSRIGLDDVLVEEYTLGHFFDGVKWQVEERGHEMETAVEIELNEAQGTYGIVEDDVLKRYGVTKKEFTEELSKLYK